ncbi:hypothetical protein AAH994_03845 [Weeksellaceae bacterium A-14]
MKKININKLSEIQGGSSGATCFFAPAAGVVLTFLMGPLYAYNTAGAVIKYCWNS